MSAPVTQVSMLAGETPLLQFGTIVDDTGTPIDLTSAAITFAISTPNKATTFVKKTLSNGVSIPDQTQPQNTGNFMVQLQESDTLSLSGNYYFEAGIILSGGYATVACGPLCVGKTIVR